MGKKRRCREVAREDLQIGKWSNRERTEKKVDGWGALTQEYPRFYWGTMFPHGALPSKREKGPEECHFLPPDSRVGLSE